MDVISAAEYQLQQAQLQQYLAEHQNDLGNIILWRKYFESLKQGDAKKDELFVHYSLVDGEYKKQPTAAETIKGWLAAKQLSWQQGFPSRSECPGQEGQLIPELHDPLLNDPDVLH